jgi:RadC-like JAB domain
MPLRLPLACIIEARRPEPHRRVGDPPYEERLLDRLPCSTGVRTTMERLALVLGTADAPGLGEDLLGRFGSLHQLARASKAQLVRVPGIGQAQAGRLVAVMELGRLQAPPAGERPRITNPADAADLHVVLLDTRNRVLDIRAVYRGSLNTSLMRVAEIFRPAIEAPAAAIVEVGGVFAIPGEPAVLELSSAGKYALVMAVRGAQAWWFWRPRHEPG